jgi:translation initiation factor 4E
MVDLNPEMATCNNIDQYHKLERKWILWAHYPQDSDWSLSSYIKIYEFGYLEEVIAVMDILPESVVKNCMLFIMREGVSPMWEDPANSKGGGFSYKVTNKFVAQTWKELAFALVGECITGNKDLLKTVNGITISPKKNFCIIKIWVSNMNFKSQPGLILNDIKQINIKDCEFRPHDTKRHV